MKKILSFFLIIFSVGCGAAGIGVTIEKNKKPSDYYSLEKKGFVKKTSFQCDFGRVSAEKSKGAFCMDLCPEAEKSDKASCVDVNSLDYVSYFTPFDYQYSKVVSSDYISNLSKNLEKDGRMVERSYIADLFGKASEKEGKILKKDKTEVFKTLDYGSPVPSSFAAEGEKSALIFLSRKDIFLRNAIYPSLKLLSLKSPDKKEDKDILAEYYLTYAVYPIVYDAPYSTDWISYYLGAPSFEKYEDKVPSLKIYFEEIKKGAQKEALGSLSGAVTPEMLARAFIFDKKIAGASREDKYAILPALPGKDRGFLNEYLPSYDLEKIEIIKKSPGGVEEILKVFSKQEIAQALSFPEETSGLSFLTEKNGAGSLSVRFTHKVRAPRFEDDGIVRRKLSGLEDIYSGLGATAITDLDIVSYYDLKVLPYDCVVKAAGAWFLKDLSVKGQGAEKYADKFTDKLSECSERELLMTKVIFLINME